MPFEPLAEIWDRFFKDGWFAIFRIALALLEMTQDSLLTVDFDTAAEQLRLATEQPPDGLIENADTIRFSKTESELILISLAGRLSDENLLQNMSRAVISIPSARFQMHRDEIDICDGHSTEIDHNYTRQSMESNTTITTTSTIQPSTPCSNPDSSILQHRVST